MKPQKTQIHRAKRCHFLLQEEILVSKNGLFEPFISKNEHFTKTGSGQI